MRVRDATGELTHHSLQIASTLERIRRTIGMDADRWTEVMGLTKRKFDRVNAGTELLPITAIHYVAEYLNLSVEAIAKGALDFMALAEHYEGNLEYIPERYLKGAFSKRLTALNFLDYLETYFGWELREKILQKLQTTEFAIRRASEPINIKFITDIGDYLRNYSFDDKDIFRIGMHTLVTNQDNPFARNLAASTTPIEIFERYDAEVAFVEKNGRYPIIKRDGETFILEFRPNPGVLDALEVDKFGSPLLCSYKAGLMAALPGYLNLPYADVREIACVHRGDQACRYEVNVEFAAARLKSG